MVKYVHGYEFYSQEMSLYNNKLCKTNNPYSRMQIIPNWYGAFMTEAAARQILGPNRENTTTNWPRYSFIPGLNGSFLEFLKT